ncbi:unnamed protein product [Ilex paraguariensis]|uniref:Wall-associated receptor kinase galacturonan-binding domain-containing protein n=1 Tax=Ilex paraguariensis TaxID=185542 RepID=A0ABC8TUR4_9AQUA
MVSGGKRRRVFLLVIQKFLLPIVLCVTSRCCKAQQMNDQNCTSSCGNIRDIHYPFRLEGDPQHCGLRDYQLACNNNRTILYLKTHPHAEYDYKYNYSFYVEAITYDNFSIRLVDPGLDKDNCSSLPLYSPQGGSFLRFYPSRRATPFFSDSYYYDVAVFISCQSPVIRSGYVDTGFCDKRNTNSTSNSTSPSPLKNHNYVVAGGMVISELEDSCSISNLVWTTANILRLLTGVNNSFSDLYDGLAYGFELRWYGVYCGHCEARGGECYPREKNRIYCDYCSYLTFALDTRIFHCE